MNHLKSLRRTSAIVTEDPAASLPVGSQLRFLPAYFPLEEELRSGWVTNWDRFRGVVMSVNFADQERQRVWGSAVAVAPGVALAARHVVQPEAEGIVASELGAILIGIAQHGSLVWRPHHITWSNESDIAIISSAAASEIPPDSIYYHTVLTTRVPKRGEPVMVVGFVAAQQEFKVADADCVVYGNVVISCGRVIDQLLQGHKQKPWPMVVIDAGALGGMSGGPAFDENGRLIGVLCASCGTGDEAYSLISLIEPALLMPFPSAWVLQNQGTATLSSMAKAGGCFLAEET